MASLYRGMDQAELDRQYDARATVPDIQPFLQRYAALSATARALPDAREAVPYGPHPAETLDIFPAGPRAPVLVFIHGGYWRLLSRRESSFMAPALRAKGIATVAVEYELAPAASLDRIVDQVRRAVAFVRREGAAFGLDGARIHLAGSSAGAHLAAMCLAEGWGMPPGAIRGALLASGLYDLAPLRLCHPNEWLKLDEDAAARNSPLRNVPASGPPVIVTYGGTDTAEFKRQSRAYASAWVAAGHSLTFREMTAHNHFDNILDLADPRSWLFAELVRQIEG
jgi:arylformamidase